ncbi:DUF4124 domain-containing protein [Arenimonas caeni]|jgi:hypothetical protein|uniref:DUF4124 domain-containing protein n=1 Tax=Arenimonas caeni TaxID=2058085 RepID=UPI0019653280|nr:DUF4124 domain-containing protein [Arenimonas caeni]MDY0023004.1 DUF4124 domain-containing protein [Arenimonas caeni]
MSRAWLLLIACLCLPAPAAAQAVYRCVGPDGQSVFSDQPCQSQGAVEREAPRPPVASAEGFVSGTGTTGEGCARSLDALLLGVRGALEARDVNRLATYYHWAGTSAGAGRYLMDSLEAIAARPLVAAEFVYEEPLAEPARPRALRVEQAAGPRDAGAVRTDFLLRRHAGCWWIEL